ncbi:hypothetical protein EDB89DRAFT_1942580 [Lactarius sanguifluus]|nr:hypothetical protein EDB89DRAFT_1942580 [Lactarius sanguifluus]
MAIGHQLPPLNVKCKRSRLQFDAACTETCGSSLALVTLIANKNEVGTYGCDPLHQCALCFRSCYARKMRPIRDSCCCPSFLIAPAGPWMCILGAVFVDNVVIQQLTDFLWIGGHPYDDDRLESVTHILTSLGTGITELREFYKKLSLCGLCTTRFPTFLSFHSALLCWRACFQLLPRPKYSEHSKHVKRFRH